MNDRDRLIHKIMSLKKPTISLQTAMDIVDAVIDESVIVPPCKVGDRVYSIFVGDTKIVRNFIDSNGDKITQIKINHKGCHFKCWWGYFHISDIGKTVFLTKEEAERALKERER